MKIKMKENYRIPPFCDLETGICIIPIHCVGMDTNTDTN
jgi:hypothetical protein